MFKRILVAATAAAALMLFLVSPASAQYQPSGSQVLSSYVVVPGQTITVSGTGCAAGSRVTTSFDSTVLGTTAATSAGTFSLQVTIPSSATLGNHQINSTCGALTLSSNIRVQSASSTGGTSTGGTAGTTGTTGGTGGALARTGVSTTPFLQVGFLLLAAGGAFLAVARTRHRRTAA